MRAHRIDKSDVSAYLDMKRIFEKSVVIARPIRRGETWGPPISPTRSPVTAFRPHAGARLRGELLPAISEPTTSFLRGLA